MMNNIIESTKKVLVVAPHTDDAEFGMGATLHRMLRKRKWEIRIVALSDCVESIPDGFPVDSLRNEAFDAGQALGVPRENICVESYPVRHFSSIRQEILEYLVAIKRSYDPDVVFAPAATDVHQDHSVVRREVDRAFKERTVLGYELVWNCTTFSASHLVPLDDVDVAAKCEAIQRYVSQKGRPYSREEVVYSLARIRGLQIGEEFAEAFDVGRIVTRLD